MTKTTTTKCSGQGGSGYCLSGVCTRYSAEERAELKALARKYWARGEEPRGRVYDGATFIVEDGEAFSLAEARRLARA